MSKIQVMSEDLANKIAAGEVVERTMNVVKELVENAIDAESTSIKIELTDSGVKEIIVTDNGIGMDKEDAMLAFSRHATSKLKTLDDLFYIHSLGFRGEALPSIASVSKITLRTCDEEQSTLLELEGGVITKVSSAPMIEGTRIEVRDLFYNTPVRLKYLRNLYTELANIVEFVDKMALSYPKIRFLLSNNDKVILNTDGSGNLLKVISNIYGVELAKKMIELNESNDDYHIYGYISYPEMTKPNKNSINILVNGRSIRNAEIVKTIKEAYHTYIPQDKYPIVVLNIEVDPILIDVNIHPTKMDIKFSKMDSLKELLTKTICSKLEVRNLIPEIKEKMIELNRSSAFDLEQEEEEFNRTLTEENFIKPKEEKVQFDFEIKEEPEKYNDIKEQPEENRIKKMYPIGVVHATYIIAENEDGMYIIDQHAAAERINYEKYLKALGTHNNHQIDLLIPIRIDLPQNEAILFKQKEEEFCKLGFELEEFGIHTFLIRSHPVWLPEYALTEAIQKIIQILIREEEFNSYKFTEKIAITLACKLSIKANDPITLTDMEDLLDRLRQCENPFTCPHGRPTIISYSKYELEKMFKRAMD